MAGNWNILQPFSSGKLVSGKLDFGKLESSKLESGELGLFFGETGSGTAATWQPSSTVALSSSSKKRGNNWALFASASVCLCVCLSVCACVWRAGRLVLRGEGAPFAASSSRPFAV